MCSLSRIEEFVQRRAPLSSTRGERRAGSRERARPIVAASSSGTPPALAMAVAAESSRRFTPGAYHGFRAIKLACKSERVPVDWDGSYADLARLFTEEFTQNEEPEGLKLLDRANEAGGCLTEAKRAFRLWDPKTRLAFENFVLDDARDGDTVQVNFEMYDRMLVALDARCLERKRAAKARKLAPQNTTGQLAQPSGSTRSFARSSSMSPRRDGLSALAAGSSSGLRAMGSALLSKVQSLKENQAMRARMYAEKKRLSDGYGFDSSQWAFLSRRERLWVTLDDPSSGPAAAAIAALFLVLIAFSTATYCLQTVHGMYEHDMPKTSFWFVSEALCIACFTAELGARLYACPNRSAFAKQPMNWVDVVAILPFYVDLIAEAASNGNADEIPGLAVIRVLRLARVFRLLRMSRGSVDLFAETMVNSVKALNMLLLLIVIGLVMFSSLAYFIERGRWNASAGYWERVSHYTCDVVVAAESYSQPNGFDVAGRELSLPAGASVLDAAATPGDVATLAWSAGSGNPCSFKALADDERSATFACAFPFRKIGKGCVAEYEQSPFDSIARALWWTWVTMTTVGYGDVNPRSVLGKTFAGLVMCFGVLVLALPVTVIGSNFSAAFHRALAEEKAYLKRQRVAERKQNASAKNSESSSPSFSRLVSLN